MKGLESGQWRCALSASNGGRGREQRECLWYEGQRYLLPRACKTIGEGITEEEKEQHFHSGLSNSKALGIIFITESRTILWIYFGLNTSWTPTMKVMNLKNHCSSMTCTNTAIWNINVCDGFYQTCTFWRIFWCCYCRQRISRSFTVEYDVSYMEISCHHGLLRFGVL